MRNGFENSTIEVVLSRSNTCLLNLGNQDGRMPAQLQGALQSLSAMTLQLHKLLLVAILLAVQCQPMAQCEMIELKINGN